MARRKKTQSTFNPKYQCYWVENTRVLEIMEKNKSYERNIKNAFKCESKNGEPRTCIYWSRLTDIFEVGCQVSLYGRIENSVFIVKKMIVYPNVEPIRKEGEQYGT